jgi:ArsR family transcriptional regulator
MPRTTDPDTRLLHGAADETRLAIIRQLAGGDEICACDFTACCEVAQPTVSHHLKVLREAGWVSTRRNGLNIYYTLRPEAIARFQALSASLTSHPRAPIGRRLPVVQPSA